MDVNTKAKKLTDHIVVTLRKRVASGEAIDYRAEAKKLNVSDFSIGRAMRGLTYTHLNRLAPPVRRRPPPVDRTKDILRLHAQKYSTNQIARTLHVGKTTVTKIVRVFNEQERERITQQKKRVIALYLKGDMKFADIAAQENISITQINKWCQGLKQQRLKKPKATHIRVKKAPFAEAPYAHCRLYTYSTKGEVRVRLIPEDGSKPITMQLGRYNMSVHLGRVLTREERVLKCDGPSNEVSNLRLAVAEKIVHRLTCQECGTTFTSKNKHAKLCSTTCTGGYLSKKKKGRPGHVYTRTCVVCDNDFQTKNNRAEVCNSPQCAEVIAKAGFD